MADVGTRVLLAGEALAVLEYRSEVLFVTKNKFAIRAFEQTTEFYYCYVFFCFFTHIFSKVLYISHFFSRRILS